MKKFLLLLFTITLACSCFAQADQNPPPFNNYPTDPQGASFYPDDAWWLEICTYGIANGVAYPLPDYPYAVGITTKSGSGYHVHQATDSLPRPVPMFVVLNTPLPPMASTTGITGSTGCAYQEVYNYGFAGWTTTTVAIQGAAVKGANYHIRYQPRIFTPGLAGFGHLGPLVPYPSDPNTNEPFSLHDDLRHAKLSRYVDPNYLAVFQRLASQYEIRTADIGPPDYVDITRCSLPDGGISDNDFPGLGPNVYVGFEWQARNFEEHRFGVECDITRKSGQLTQLANAANDAGCSLGIFTPDGFPSSWSSSDIVHITCAGAKALKRPGIGR